MPTRQPIVFFFSIWLPENVTSYNISFIFVSQFLSITKKKKLWLYIQAFNPCIITCKHRDTFLVTIPGNCKRCWYMLTIVYVLMNTIYISWFILTVAPWKNYWYYTVLQIRIVRAKGHTTDSSLGLTPSYSKALLFPGRSIMLQVMHPRLHEQHKLDSTG